MSVAARRILVAEDERNLAEGIRENLEIEGYEVDVVHDGAAALERMRRGRYDLVLLDVMMPEMDGLSVCESARTEGVDVPVLFLTARTAPRDRIRGLEAGGDDYLTKPFHLRELLLRVAAILKRTEWLQRGGDDGHVLRFGGNEVDFASLSGRTPDGREERLTQKEAMILRVLAEREGRIVSRDEILEKVWGAEASPSTRTIDNFIVRLRKRFEPEPETPRHIHTARGVGYRFTLEPKPDPR